MLLLTNAIRIRKYWPVLADTDSILANERSNTDFVRRFETDISNFNQYAFLGLGWFVSELTETLNHAADLIFFSTFLYMFPFTFMEKQTYWYEKETTILIKFFISNKNLSHISRIHWVLCQHAFMDKHNFFQVKSDC